MGWFSGKAKDQKPAAPLTAAEMIKKLPKDAKDEFERPDFIINQDIAGCLYFLSTDEETIRQSIEAPGETIPDKALAERLKEFQPEAPWTKDVIRKFLVKRIDELVALSGQNGAPENEWQKRIAELGAVDADAVIEAACFMLGDPSSLFAKTEKAEAARASIYAAVRPVLIENINKAMKAVNVSIKSALNENETVKSVRTAENHAAHEQLARAARQFAALSRQNPDPANKDWITALSVVFKHDPALAGALALQEKAEHPENTSQALNSMIFIQSMPEDDRKKALADNGVKEDSFREDLIKGLSDFALESADQGFSPDVMAVRIMTVAALDWHTGLAAASRIHDALTQAEKTEAATFASLLALDIRSRSLVRGLAMEEDERAAFLGADNKPEDELEQQALTTLSDYAHKTQESGFFEIAWPQKINAIAQVDTELAGQAAKKAFQDAAGQILAPGEETKDNRDNLQTAFNAALEMSEALANEGYFHTSADIADDLCDFADLNGKTSQETRELLQGNLKSIMTAWKARVDANPDDESRAVAQKTMIDFITTRIQTPPASFKA